MEVGGRYASRVDEEGIAGIVVPAQPDGTISSRPRRGAAARTRQMLRLPHLRLRRRDCTPGSTRFVREMPHAQLSGRTGGERQGSWSGLHRVPRPAWRGEKLKGFIEAAGADQVMKRSQLIITMLFL